MKVKSVKIVKESVNKQFYDIEVADNHSFCVRPHNETQISNKSLVAHNCSFGLLYGKSIVAIAEEYFRGDVKYAQSLFDMFFSMFPAIKTYMEQQKQQLFEHGYVTTVWGDPIYITYNANSLYVDARKFIAQFAALPNPEDYPNLLSLYLSYQEGRDTLESLEAKLQSLV